MTIAPSAFDNCTGNRCFHAHPTRKQFVFCTLKIDISMIFEHVKCYSSSICPVPGDTAWTKMFARPLKESTASFETELWASINCVHNVRRRFIITNKNTEAHKTITFDLKYCNVYPFSSQPASGTKPRCSDTLMIIRSILWDIFSYIQSVVSFTVISILPFIQSFDISITRVFF